MADYFVPRVQVEQEFSQIAVFSDNPLAALIIGPQYAEAAEKAGTLVLEASNPVTNVNYYVGTQRDYNYQQKGATSVIDTDYVKVFLDKTAVDYYSTASAVTVSSTNKNQITSASKVFKTGYSGTTNVGADVLVGDTVTVWDAASNPTEILSTKVRSVIASKTAGTIPSTATAVSGGATEDSDIAVNVTGTFTGTQDITYRIIVDQGGAWGSATVRVLSNGTDSAGPFLVSNSTGSAHSPKYALGTQGLYFDFVPTVSGTDVLVTGNEWTVKIVAPTYDKYNILELEDNIPSTFSTPYLAALGFEKDGVEVARIRDLNAATTNWVVAQDKITLKSSITITDSRVTNTGVLVPLTVKTASVYVERRDLIKDNTAAAGNVTSLGGVEEKLGTVHPDNALAQGVYNAVLNSSSSTVYFIGVASDDLAGYVKALEIAKKDTKYHGLVPLSSDPTIVDAFISHADALSASKQAKWRTTYVSRNVEDSTKLYDLKSNGTNWQAYVSAVPSTSIYSYVTIGYDSGSALVPDAAAKLLTDGVRAGDKLLYNFRIDGTSGEVINDETTVVSVTSQNTLIVEKDWLAAQSLPFKVEIRRDFTVAEKASNYKAILAGYNDRRVTPVFPDTFKSGTVVQSGYLAAAYVAGLASGVVPHQSLTNLEVLGPTDLSRVVTEFTEDDLDSFAAEGCLIITQASIGSSAYVRHQLTSDTSSLNKSENSVTRNVDSISYALQAALAPYVGIYNINAGSILKVRAAIDKALNFRLTGTATETAGPQLLGYEITKLTQDATFKDKLLVEVTLTVPYPMNYITVTLLV
jgi:hypothetical protein